MPSASLGSSSPAVTGTMLSSVANLLNTLIGAGICAMPYAMKYTGLLPGIGLIVLCSFTSASGLYLLTRCAAKVGGRGTSFFSVARKTIPSGARWFDLAIALKCYGVSISYLIIGGQLMPQVMISFFKAFGKDPHEIPGSFLNRDLWILIFMVFLTPLCFLRRLDSLRHTSYVSFIAVVYLVIIVVFYGLMDHAKAHLPPRGDVDLIKIDGHLVSIFPIFVFAFTCAQNMFPVYNELANNSESRVNAIIVTSIGTAAVIYEIVAVLGYISFGSNIGSNIIAMYPATSVFVCGGRIAIVLLTLCCYPLQIHPCRASFDKVFSKARGERIVLPSDPVDALYEDWGHEGDSHREGDEEDTQVLLDDDTGARRPEGKADAIHDIPLRRWCILTGLILSTTFTISLFIDDLSIVLGFVGSIGSTTISFILPGVLYAVLHQHEPEQRRMRRFAQALAVWGALVLVFTFTANVLKVLRAAPGTMSQGHGDRLAALLAAHESHVSAAAAASSVASALASSATAAASAYSTTSAAL
ncbi:hypothetical protein K437DRAFT_220449 [Tilletiaria anomala UBC 951]|uniref:Amino acid transporter transmembrane domain-containing protein n=1 Tax=Tilletiaria anomala (strain ATCC 24038 / CBS 436.72 / UBC 951) TaxID=1037660 RepID=A0A066WIX2_TILAU|nr:uncharacterized protein K437DRAFT_220449 [Tilletiaria anomala UBC 951]KDN52498.1 hypothetical protein K437DRAFT_220449 [Tilletiaria anomala UBC 951]